MGKACSTYGGEERCIQGFGGGKDHLKDPGVGGRVILKWIIEKCVEGIDWIDPAQDRDRWRAVVNSVMNLRVL
jgi:hypothetical protein